MYARIRHIVDRGGSSRFLVRIRALLRGNELYLIPLALVIGAAVGAIVTLMAEIAQIMHVLIYGIPIDVRLSANDWVNPWAAMIAPAVGGLTLGLMEWWRRRLKLASAVDPVEVAEEAAREGVSCSSRINNVFNGECWQYEITFRAVQ